MQHRIRTLITALSEHMYEREHMIALSLLAGVAGANTFLYGAPGTAKSLISRRIAAAFEVERYFEYLMNRFSTPEELFGPVSLKALKQDQYTRKTAQYLPKAEVAFLDEIWKASPAILNTLLTLLNEKIFKNGDEIETVPLQVLMSASNEIPQPEQGLDALYDRFILRLVVQPIQKPDNFFALLQAGPSQPLPQHAIQAISLAELRQWRSQIHAVQLSPDILIAFLEIKTQLSQEFAEHQVYVSDRRWQRVAYLMKTAAFLNGRDTVLISDLFILKHCLWNQLNEISFVNEVVNTVVLRQGLSHDLNLERYVLDKEQLEQDILNHAYYTEDVYYSYLINGVDYLHVTTNLDHYYQNKSLYLALDKFGTHKDFFALDASGEEVRGIVCNFNGTTQCTLKGGYYGLEEVVSPQIKYSKGSMRSEVDSTKQQQLRAQLQRLQQAFSQEQQLLQQRVAQYDAALDSVFVEPADRIMLRQQIQEQLQRYALQIQDCERLDQLCQP